jgi:hypothetical protein
MREVWKFSGGQLVLRHEGMMFDKSTGKKTEWGRAVKIMGSSKPIVLDAAQMGVLAQIMQDDEVMLWLDGQGSTGKA